MANPGNVSPTSKSMNSHVSAIDPSFKIVDTFQSLYKKRLMDAGESVQLKNIVLKDWVDDLSAQNEAMIRSLITIENDVSKKGAGCGIKQDSENQRKRIIELEECIKCLNRTICEKDAQISRVMCESTQLKEQCEQQGMTLQSQEGAANENVKLNEEVKNLRCCLREKECQIQEISQQLSEVTSTLCTREEEMTRSAVNKLDFCSRIELLEEELCNLKRENDEKEELLKKYCRECTSMKREIVDAKRQKEELCALQNDVDCLRDELAQKSCALEKAKAHIKELRSSNYGLSCAPPRNTSPYPPQFENRSAERGMKYLKVGHEIQEDVHAGIAQIQEQRDDGKDYGGSGDSLLIELNKKLDNQKDLQKALTAEVAEKHDAIITLKEQIHELENKLRQTEIQAHFKDDIIRELRKEVKLGRAKESLAEMLGLKEGPRVQMKARIDRLNSELEDRKNEISRLNSLMDNSSLATLQTQVRTLTLDLESRDRRILEMCDKMEYIRSYLNQLKTEEQLSIKCGLEALITELNDDMEKNREVRRNVSISLDKEPNDNVIIINHRSHSLPDSALKRQVHNFQVTSKCGTAGNLHGTPFRSMRFAFEDLSKLKKLGSSLESSQANLCHRWDAVRQTNEVEFMKCQKELDDIIESMEADRQCIFTVCCHFESLSSRLYEAQAKCSPNEFIFTSIEDCLKNMLNNFDLNFKCDPENTLMVNMKSLLYQNMKSNITVALSQLERAKTRYDSQKDLICTFDLLRLNDDQKTLETLASNKLNIIRQLSSVKNLQDSYSKCIVDKLTEFDSDIVQHLSKTNNVKSELEVIVEQFEKLQGADSSLISVYTSTDDLPLKENNEISCASGQVLENVLKRVDSSKLLEIMDHDDKLVELFSPSTPFRSKFSHSSFRGDSTSRETGDNSAGIEEKGNVLRTLAATLSLEIKSLITQVIQRDQKVFDFEKSGFALCKSLDQTQYELTNALALTDKLGISFEKHSSLVQSLSDTACEVQKLLKEAKAYLSEREMIEALRLRKELCVSNLMMEMLKNVEDIVNEVKNAQNADDDLLRSFSSQIQTYREKILELESKAVKQYPPTILATNDLTEAKDEVICALTSELHSAKEQCEELQARLIQEMEEKSSLKTENERTLEELQIKISKLQEVLQEEKITSSDQTIAEKLRELEDVLTSKDQQIQTLEARLRVLSNEESTTCCFGEDSEQREIMRLRDALKESQDKFEETEAAVQQWRRRANENKQAIDNLVEENKELKEQLEICFNDNEQKYCNLNTKRLEVEENCRQLIHERAVVLRHCQNLADESAQMKRTLENQNVKLDELRKMHNKICKENELIRMEDEAAAKLYKEKIAHLEDELKLKDGALEHLQLELKNLMTESELLKGNPQHFQCNGQQEGQFRSRCAYNDKRERGMINLIDLEKPHSTCLPLNGVSEEEVRDDINCSLAACEKKISELLMERSNHLLMMKRMRDFTGQLSKFRPQGDAEIDSSSDGVAESSPLSSANENDEPWYEHELRKFFR